jgi:hypothetical protein
MLPIEKAKALTRGSDEGLSTIVKNNALIEVSPSHKDEKPSSLSPFQKKILEKTADDYEKALSALSKA